MSGTDGESSNRLSAALDELFAKSERGGDAAPPPPPTPGETTQAMPTMSSPTSPPEVVPIDHGDGDGDGDDGDGDFEFPEIVPATEDPPEVVEPAAALSPTLPARRVTPEPASEPPAPVAPSRPVSAPTTVASPVPAPIPAPGVAPATGWGDHFAATPTTARPTSLRAPGRRPRVRRVTRVLRHIDPWSTFKVALLFSLVTYLVALTSGVLLWRVADSTGTLDNVERWFTQFGWETFELKGGEIFHNAWIIGLFGAVAMTGGLVLLATLFNLVSDIIGGVRLTVLEEEVVERTISSTRRYVVRQGAAAAGAAGVPEQTWDIDDDATEASQPESSPSVSAVPGSPSAPSATPTESLPTTTWTPTPNAATTGPPPAAPPGGGHAEPTADWSIDDD